MSCGLPARMSCRVGCRAGMTGMRTRCLGTRDAVPALPRGCHAGILTAHPELGEHRAHLDRFRQSGRIAGPRDPAARGTVGFPAYSDPGDHRQCRWAWDYYPGFKAAALRIPFLCSASSRPWPGPLDSCFSTTSSAWSCIANRHPRRKSRKQGALSRALGTDGKPPPPTPCSLLPAPTSPRSTSSPSGC